MPTIEHYFSAHSAYAYLGAAQLSKIAAAHGWQVVHKPINLTTVVKAAHPGGFAGRSKAHISYFFGREIERWSECRNVPFKGGVPANHSNDTTLANSMMIAASQQQENIDDLAHEIMQQHWLHHSDLADPSTLAAAARKTGFDPEQLLAAAKTPDVAALYAANTQHALDAHFFGSPTYVVDGDAFYGQDRLELVERALTQPFTRSWSG